MIDLSCSRCGSDLTLTASSEWSGKVNVEATCPTCTITMDDALDDVTRLTNQVERYADEISGLYFDVDEQGQELDQLRHEIKDLKDFIDGYIDDKAAL